MKRTRYPIVLISLIISGVIACNFPVLPISIIPGTPTPTPTITETPTTVPTATNSPTPVPPTATDTPLPTVTSAPYIPVFTTPTLAPFCESDIPIQSDCHYPIAEQSSVFCSKKSPYTLVAINERATFDVLYTENIQCSDGGVVDGQRVITCTGPMAYSFELKVCDSACSSLTTEKGSRKCPYGYTYNSLENCCTKELQEVNQGCTVLSLKTTSCSINCGQFRSKSSCQDYGYACRWDSEARKCILKR